MATNASGRTPNIGLSQWLAEDYIHHDDFNSDNMIIDGLLASAPRIQTGSYVGDGTKDAENAITLTFDFVPKVVIVMCEEGAAINGSAQSAFYSNWFLGLYGTKVIQVRNSTSGHELTMTWNNNSVSWWSTGPMSHMNQNNYTYNYFALG